MCSTYSLHYKSNNCISEHCYTSICICVYGVINSKGIGNFRLAFICAQIVGVYN